MEVEAAKLIGAGLATIALAGAGIRKMQQDMLTYAFGG